VVQDAVAIVAFIRTAGFEVLGTIPTTIQNAIQTIQKEQELYLQHQQQTQGKQINNDDNENTSMEPVNSQPSITDSIVIDSSLLNDAIKLVQQIEPVLKEQRALMQTTSENLVKHCVGAYRAISTSYIQTHQKMKKLEKRCAEDRLIAGQLTAQREKGFTDAQKLCDNLQKSVEVLSDYLHEPMPIIVTDDENDADRAMNTGSGIEVWTKDSNDANKDNFGPFDDEEMRSFYCDIPDLLATIPPALLGLSEEQVEKQKILNLRKYSVGATTNANGEEDAAAAAAAITPSSAEQLDAAELGVTLDDDDNVEGNKTESGTFSFLALGYS
jgi:regulator of nonsense transcripts 2